MEGQGGGGGRGGGGRVEARRAARVDGVWVATFGVDSVSLEVTPRDRSTPAPPHTHPPAVEGGPGGWGHGGGGAADRSPARRGREQM